jgi:hypothetical protein
LRLFFAQLDNRQKSTASFEKIRRTLSTARVQGKAQMWYLGRPFLAGWSRFHRDFAALFDFLSAGANTPWL